MSETNAVDPNPKTSQGNIQDTANLEKLIDSRIRQNLFNLKFLGTAGAVLIAVILYFHKDLLAWGVSYGGKELQHSIEVQNKSYLEEFKKQVEKHLDVLQTTQRNLEQAQAQFKASNEAALKEQDRFSDKIADFRQQYLELTRQAESLRKESESAHNKVTELIKSLEEVGEVTRTRIADAQQRATAEADKRIAELEKRFALLQTTLAADLKDRGSDKSIPPVITDVSAPIQKPTVYFQFAGFSREEAQAISKAIRERGNWHIPGEERTPKAAGTNEVRFNPADRFEAMSLVRDANEALKSLGIAIKLVPKENAAVRTGFTEIWVFKP